MPYAAVVTVIDLPSLYGAQGKRAKLITIGETLAAATDEWSASLGWQVVTVIGYKVTLGAGAAATVNPALGNATGWTVDTQAHIATNTTTAAFINDQTAVVCPLTNSGILYGRNTVNAGADNTISTEVVVVEGVV